MFDSIASRRTPSAAEDHAARELRLTLIEAGWSCRLQQPLVIGRDAGCDLRIDDAQVGRRHAEIYPIGTQWWVRDLGTENGTFLKGEIVEAEPVRAPSEIRLGVGGPTLRLDGLNDSSPAG